MAVITFEVGRNMRVSFGIEPRSIEETDGMKGPALSLLGLFVEQFLKTWKNYGMLRYPTLDSIAKTVQGLKDEEVRNAWILIIQSAKDYADTLPMIEYSGGPGDMEVALLSDRSAAKRQVPFAGSSCAFPSCSSVKCITDEGKNEAIKNCLEFIRLARLQESLKFKHAQDIGEGKLSEIAVGTPHVDLWRDRFQPYADPATQFVIIDKHAAIRCVKDGNFNSKSGLCRFLNLIDRSGGQRNKCVTVYAACNAKDNSKENPVTDPKELIDILEEGFNGRKFNNISKLYLHLPYEYHFPSRDRFIRFDHTTFNVGHPLQTFEGSKNLTEKITWYSRTVDVGPLKSMQGMEEILMKEAGDRVVKVVY